MGQIQASQLIYTNVKAAESPYKRDGYQTLFYTHRDLSETEILEVEARLFYRASPGPQASGNQLAPDHYQSVNKQSPRGLQSPPTQQQPVPLQPVSPQPVKRVYFATPGGKVALAHIVPLSDRDEAGRTGRIFAHTLIFSPEAFLQVDNNPFFIFRQFPFMTTVEEALTTGEFATGNIAPAQVEALSTPFFDRDASPNHTELNNLGLSSNQSGLDIGQRLQPPQLLALLQAANQAVPLQQSGNAVAFFGAMEDMSDFLEILFPLIPRPQRLRCSFDTFFMGGDLSRLPYWAIGLPPSETRKPNLLIFDLKKGYFNYDANYSHVTAYGRWLEQSLRKVPDQVTLASIVQQSAGAYWLGEWFEGRAVQQGQLERVQPSTYQELATLNRPALQEKVGNWLSHQGGALSLRVLPHAMRWIDQQGAGALSCLGQNISEQLLQEWLVEVCADCAPGFSRQELADLEALAARTHQSKLRLPHLRWTKQWSELGREVRRLDDEQFKQFVAWALGTVAADVKWRVTRSEQDFVFGPAIGYQDAASAEAASLIYALLGVMDPPRQTGNSAARGGMLNIFNRKNKDAESPLIAPAHAKRWLWIMSLLEKQDGATLEK